MDRDILPEDLIGEMDKLKQQLQVVSKRVSAMIMQDWPSYSSQLKDIGEIQKDLDSILSVMQNMRKLVFFYIVEHLAISLLRVILSHATHVIFRASQFSLTGTNCLPLIFLYYLNIMQSDIRHIYQLCMCIVSY